MSMAFKLDHIYIYIFHGVRKGCRICFLRVVIVKSVFYVYPSEDGLSLSFYEAARLLGCPKHYCNISAPSLSVLIIFFG